MAIESVLSSNRGFLYEVELLYGLASSIKQGNKQCVVRTAKAGTQMKIDLDPKLLQDGQIADNISKELVDIINSITTQNPKADIMCSIGEGGAVSIFGVSVKSVSITKSKAIVDGYGAKKVSVGLHSSYLTIKNIFSKYNKSFSSVLGASPA